MMSALKRTIFVCLLACFLKCSVSEEEKNVKTGDNVILQCQGPRDADTVMLKWIRPDLKSDGYVLYFSDHQEQKQHQHFHGRVELIDPQMKDGDFSVILKNVNINDTGTYECRVGYKGSKPQTISTTKLTVITSGADEHGGDKDGGDKGGGDRDGHVGLIVGLSVVVVLVVVAGFMIYGRCRRLNQQNQLPAEAADHELQYLNQRN